MTIDYGYLGGLLLAFLAGSISFSGILARLKQVDLRSQGSGNMGATNVARVMGKPWGILVFVLDFGKGALPVYWGQGIWGPEGLVIIGLLAILGHIYSPFLGFKGGKGVATAVGVLTVLVPQIVGVMGLLLALVFWMSRTISLVSILGAVLLPILMIYFDSPMPYKVVLTGVSLLIIWRHRQNILRLLKGQENRF